MEVRSATLDDLRLIDEIDGTIRSNEYLHVEQSGKELEVGWSLQPRPFREAITQPNPLGDELRFSLKQVLSGSEEGTVLLAIHDDSPAALLFAQPRHLSKTLQVVDLRVDFDFRRQGIATAMLFMLIADARERELRAVEIQTATDNGPALRLLSRTGFDLCGLDTRRRSNHDLVKEAATLLWYAALD